MRVVEYGVVHAQLRGAFIHALDEIFHQMIFGQMFCQLCHKPMPFDVGGEPYFEAVQFVRDSGRDLPANRLALCPTCGARYRHALETPLADLRAYLMRTQVGREPSVELPLVAAGARLRLRFVGKHAIDLQAELRATAGREIEDDLEFG